MLWVIKLRRQFYSKQSGCREVLLVVCWWWCKGFGKTLDLFLYLPVLQYFIELENVLDLASGGHDASCTTRSRRHILVDVKMIISGNLDVINDKISAGHDVPVCLNSSWLQYSSYRVLHSIVFLKKSLFFMLLCSCYSTHMHACIHKCIHLGWD